MVIGRARFAALATAVLVSGACGTLRARTVPAASDDWPPALGIAQTRAMHGDFDGADSVLAAFAVQHPGTDQALETAYWRALFKMDPSNRNASVTTAVASLDGYLAAQRQRAHLTEATTLRRAAAQIAELNKLAANAMSQARDAKASAANANAAAADARDAARATPASESSPSPDAQAEIKRLKDELAKANAELDRIRKRLTQPPPPR